MSGAPVVYVWGDEAFLVDRALREIEAEVLPGGGADFNRELFEAPDASASAVVNAAKTLPFLGGRKLVLVKGAHLWSADAWQPLLPYIEAPNPTTCLVLVAATLDRRLKAGKLIEKKARLVACKKPEDREMAGWVQRLTHEAGLRLGPGGAQGLAYRVGPDLQLLAQEVEKLKVFAGESGVVSAQDIEVLVGQARGASIFVFCDALGRRDLGLAMRTLRRLLELGEPPVKVVFMVHRHFRNLLAVRALTEGGGRVDRAVIAKAVGVPPFAAENLVTQAGGWTLDALKDVFSQLVAADLSLKSGGATEVLDGLVLSLSGKPAAAVPGFREQKSPGRGRGS